MVLGHDAILHEYRLGNIIISPFREDFVSVNSYDVRLGPDMYQLLPPHENGCLSPYDEPESRFRRVGFNDSHNGHSGWILDPGIYLGSTVEEIGTAARSGLIPDINAKSTFGRNGLTVALCAGKGDVGYAARWTLEIHVRYPTLLLVNTVIAQVRFSRCEDAGVYGGEGSYQPGGQIRMLPKPMKVVAE